MLKSISATEIAPFATNSALSEIIESAFKNKFKSSPISSVELSPIRALIVESAVVSESPAPKLPKPEAPPWRLYPEPKSDILL